MRPNIHFVNHFQARSGYTCLIVDIPDTVKASFEGIELSAIAREDVLIIALEFRGLVECVEHEPLNFMQSALGYVFY